jgi:ABC-type transport system substrate-binding protein
MKWNRSGRTRAGWPGAVVLGLMLGLAACGEVPNSPHPGGAERENTLFSSFQERSPKYLDPVSSYANNETPVTYQVYEPLYGYHYLKRPYELVPKGASRVVAVPRYFDKDGKELGADAPGEQIAESVYDIPIRRGMRYSPHPAFAKDAQGNYLYHKLTEADVRGKRSPFDWAQTGTREVTAEDYVYTVKRNATTRTLAVISSVFAEYVVGLKDYMDLIQAEDKKLLAGTDASSLDKPFLDFRKYPLAGASAPDPYTLRLRIKGKYPQMKYWMAMTFFAPTPWEVDYFYTQPGMAFNGLSMNTWPVGSGPYMMVDYVRDRQHILKRNPNYRTDDLYPCEGEASDSAAGFLKDCGKPMPFIDTLVFRQDKEKVPLKAKFRAGFLDVPEIERTEYGVEFSIDADDDPKVAAEFKQRGMQFPKFLDPSIWYTGFNMLDPVVGWGSTPEQQAKNRKLRQAISIAIDFDEWNTIFPTKGGVAGMGPMPPGVFGSRYGTAEGVNPVTHVWKDGRYVRRPIEDAKRLLAEAGYPDGRDAKTGKPLVINYDFQRALTPEFRAEVDWMAKQFAKINIQLEIRATDFNQYQDKKRKGALQFYFGGWLADYPDAENFLFLLYGPNASAKFDGENISNYDNPEYNKRFERLKLLDDGPEKQKLIDELEAIAREDAVWSFGYYPYAGGAFHQWVGNGKPATMIRDMAKYYTIDAPLRAEKIREWNQPVRWPLALIVLVLALAAIPAIRMIRRREAARGLSATTREPAVHGATQGAE